MIADRYSIVPVPRTPLAPCPVRDVPKEAIAMAVCRDSNSGTLAMQEAIMFGWIVRGVLIVAGFVASWLVTKDSPQFGFMEMAVATLLLVIIVAVLAFWPERWTHILNRLHKLR
jgi:hypothetical protein